MKLPSNVLQFAAGNDAPYKMFKDYWFHYLSMNGEGKYEFEKEISFSEKEEKMNAALKREICRVAGVQNFDAMPVEAWVSNPMLSWATFAVVGSMIDAILPESMIDTIGLYTEVKSGGYGDSFAFNVKPRDLFVVSKAGRARRMTEVHKQYEGQITVVPEPRELTVQVSMFRVLTGNESLAEFTAKAIRSMEYQINKDCYQAFNDAMANLPNTAGNMQLRVAGYTQDALVTLAQKVTAWNGGAKAILVGTQLALSKVLPAGSNYRYDIQSDFVKVGYVRTAFGYDVLALPQVADWTSPFGLVLDDAKLYVISPSSQKLVKLCLEGGTVANVSQPMASANLTQNATLQKSWGTAVVTAAIAGVITLP